jgi:hypothetical protein
MRVAQQPVGTLDAMTQVRPAAKSASNLGQRQPRAAHCRGHGLKQHRQAPTVDAGKQRCDTTL